MMEKYLLIFEDGSMGQSNIITDNDIEAVADGILDVIRFKNGVFEYYFEDDWHEVKECD